MQQWDECLTSCSHVMVPFYKFVTRLRKAMFRPFEPDFEALCKAALAHLETSNVQHVPTLKEAINFIEDKDIQGFCQFVNIHPPSILAEKVSEVITLFREKANYPQIIKGVVCDVPLFDEEKIDNVANQKTVYPSPQRLFE